MLFFSLFSGCLVPGFLHLLPLFITPPPFNTSSPFRMRLPLQLTLRHHGVGSTVRYLNKPLKDRWKEKSGKRGFYQKNTHLFPGCSGASALASFFVLFFPLFVWFSCFYSSPVFPRFFLPFSAYLFSLFLFSSFDSQPVCAHHTGKRMTLLSFFLQTRSRVSKRREHSTFFFTF